MIVIALTSIRHMLLYLTGIEASSATMEIWAPSENKKGVDAAPTKHESSQDEFYTLRAQLTSARTRMLAEIAALARRGNLNLAIGIFTTLAATSLLASIVYTSKVEYTNTASV